jgi:hypothetical protein
MVPAGGEQSVNLVSNQYLLKLGTSLQVYQYALDISPMPIWDANQVHRIVRTKARALERGLGHYVCSGKSIYTINEIEEDLTFKTMFRGQEYIISIDKTTEAPLMLDGTFSNKDNDVKQQLINVIIKEAFRGTDLKQIGKSPRFFDTNNPMMLH